MKYTYFEVLKRDAWIAYWRGRAEGGDDTALATALRDQLLSDLDDGFAFVATHQSLVAKPMADEDQTRLGPASPSAAGYAPWTIAWGFPGKKPSAWSAHRLPPLPVEEPLLADRPEHLMRAERTWVQQDNRWGFKLDVPAYKFNRGDFRNCWTSPDVDGA